MVVPKYLTATLFQRKCDQSLYCEFVLRLGLET